MSKEKAPPKIPASNKGHDLDSSKKPIIKKDIFSLEATASAASVFASDKKTIISADQDLSKAKEATTELSIPRFKNELKRIVEGCRAIDSDVWRTFFPMKQHLSMSIQDLRDCIVIVKNGIIAKHYAGDVIDGCRILIKKLENELAGQLINIYYTTPKELKASDWDFLSTYFLDYGTRCSRLKDADMKDFVKAKKDFDDNQANTSDVEVDAIFQSTIERLFDKTGEILQQFIRLADSGYLMPEDYDRERTAGFAELSADGNFVERRQIGTGKILRRVDKDCGYKAKKYGCYAVRKDLMCLLENKEYSEQTSFKIKGRIPITCKGRHLGFSYSGGTQYQDQAIVIIVAHAAGVISDDDLHERQMRLQNPYLEPKFLAALRTV